MTFIDATTAQSTLTTMWSGVSQNLAGILAVFGFIVGLSIVMALLDSAKDGRLMEQRVARSNKIHGNK